MHLLAESAHVEDYLAEDEVVNYSHPLVRQALCQIQNDGAS